MPLVAEDGLRGLQLAVTFDVHLVVAVHEDVRDGRVLQQHLERPEPEELMQDVADQGLAFEQAQRRAIALALEHAADQCADFRLGVFALHAREPIQVQPVQQLLVDLSPSAPDSWRFVYQPVQS